MNYDITSDLFLNNNNLFDLLDLDSKIKTIKYIFKHKIQSLDYFYELHYEDDIVYYPGISKNYIQTFIGEKYCIRSFSDNSHSLYVIDPSTGVVKNKRLIIDINDIEKHIINIIKKTNK